MTSPSSSRTVPLVAVDRTSPVPIVTIRIAGRWISVAATTSDPPNSRRPPTAPPATVERVRAELIVGDADQLQSGRECAVRLDDLIRRTSAGAVANRRATISVSANVGWCVVGLLDASGRPEHFALLDVGEPWRDRLQRRRDPFGECLRVGMVRLTVSVELVCGEVGDDDRLTEHHRDAAARLDLALVRHADRHDHDVGGRRQGAESDASGARLHAVEPGSVARRSLGKDRDGRTLCQLSMACLEHRGVVARPVAIRAPVDREHPGETEERSSDPHLPQCGLGEESRETPEHARRPPPDRRSRCHGSPPRAPVGRRGTDRATRHRRSGGTPAPARFASMPIVRSVNRRNILGACSASTAAYALSTQASASTAVSTCQSACGWNTESALHSGLPAEPSTHMAMAAPPSTSNAGDHTPTRPRRRAIGRRRNDHHDGHRNRARWWHRGRPPRCARRRQAHDESDDRTAVGGPEETSGVPTGDESERSDQGHIVEELRQVAGSAVEQQAAHTLCRDDRSEPVRGRRQSVTRHLNRHDHPGQRGRRVNSTRSRPVRGTSRPEPRSQRCPTWPRDSDRRREPMPVDHADAQRVTSPLDVDELRDHAADRQREVDRVPPPVVGERLRGLRRVEVADVGDAEDEHQSDHDRGRSRHAR